MGTNDTVKQNLGKIKQDFRALGAQVKGRDAQVIFFSVLPVRGRGAGRGQYIMQINNLVSWLLLSLGFGFNDHGKSFNEYNLLGRDRIHLPRRGRRIFTSRSAALPILL